MLADHSNEASGPKLRLNQRWAASLTGIKPLDPSSQLLPQEGLKIRSCVPRRTSSVPCCSLPSARYTAESPPGLPDPPETGRGSLLSCPLPSAGEGLGQPFSHGFKAKQTRGTPQAPRAGTALALLIDVEPRGAPGRASQSSRPRVSAVTLKDMPEPHTMF